MTELNRPSNSEREEVQDERFSGERIVIDGKHFEDCTSSRSELLGRFNSVMAGRAGVEQSWRRYVKTATPTVQRRTRGSLEHGGMV